MGLISFVEEIIRLRDTFENISFKPIYREKNVKVDVLSKEGFKLKNE